MLARTQSAPLMASIKRPRVITDDYEIVEQCGQGTYGFVFKAIHKQSKTIVALKKVTKFPTEDGAPVEIKYLSQLTTSRNVIRLRDHFFTKEAELVLVFEFMETDLWKLISVPGACLPLFHIKCVMKQLLEGLHQCHNIGVMHRDIKPSNLLINSSGILKLADFGLSTSFITPPYLSNNVVSLYYRPPELLMGSHSYGAEIDVWSAGCILVELFISDYLFAGSNDTEQLELIFKAFGTPTEEVWPGVTQLPGWGLAETGTQHPLRELKDNHANLEPHVMDLASKLLQMNPKKRISCQEALQHPWFSTTPLPSHPNNLPILWRQTTGEPPKEWRTAINTSEMRIEGGSALFNLSSSSSNSGKWDLLAKKSGASTANNTPLVGKSNPATPLLSSKSNPNAPPRVNDAGEDDSGINIMSTKSPKTPRVWSREKSRERLNTVSNKA